ncbi:hypothetical protein BDA99DRAFT_432922 [Phascolomyces articulosus]|uniref:FAS1-like dehydratase domain-containing protein n=1 Tax=Phascolomyces articulosus TaxID=60185 RepID=A0AAD5K7Q7_9FUNG|nr:hypothetical protein BDA99DRAFT_432922 [Phascolomyces articulosus]
MVSSSSDGSCQTNDTTSIVDEWRTRTMQEQTEAFDIITASPLNLLANTLNERALSFAGNVLPEKGTVVPGTYHHVYFPPRTRESELAKDGYETVFHPPYPFTQRMWAGAELTFDKENPLCVDDEATMITKVNRIEHRIGGRLGDTVMVWLDKDIYNQKGWSMREQRTLVYATEQEASSSPSPRILKEPDFSMTMHPTSILLFRYSALTFNSHMIHYDQNYAQHVEHHPSCLVHGPLSSTLLITLLRTHLYTQFQSDLVLKSFQYRCLAPLYVNQPLTLFGRVTPGDNKSFELWVNDHQNNLAVKGTAVVA